MKDSEIVSAAREMISNPDAWIKGDWCLLDDSGGLKMCAEGAIMNALGLVDRSGNLTIEANVEDCQPLSQFYLDQVYPEGYMEEEREKIETYYRIKKRLEETAFELMPEVHERVNHKAVARWDFPTDPAEEPKPGIVGYEDHKIEPDEPGYITPEEVWLNVYNDSAVTKHEDVLAIFDKAAAKMQEEGE